MPQSLNCPNCSAPLDVKDSGASTIRCPYCNTSVIVPEELRVKSPVITGISPSHVTFRSAAQVNINKKVEFIKEMAHAGNKIVAVKAMRDTFEVGVKQADEMVEAIQHGKQVEFSRFKVRTPASGLSTLLDSTRMQQIIHLVESGDKIGAIRLFREANGVSLKEAKDVIDGMEVSISATPIEVSGDINSGIPYLAKIRKVNPLAEARKGGRSCVVTGFILFLILVTIIPILMGMTSQGGPLAGVWARINPFAAGKMTLAFGKEGTGSGYFTGARFISVDNNGHIFVGEQAGGRV